MFIRVVADLKDLWTYKSFRARIFFAIVPTFMAVGFGFLALDRTQPYVYDAAGSYIEPSTGHAGDQLTAVWHLRLTRQCSGTIERRLVDMRTGAVIAQYDPVPAVTNVVTKDFKYMRRTFRLPQKLPAGLIGYHVKATYECNWFQVLFPSFAIRFTTPTLYFLVEE